MLTHNMAGLLLARSSLSDATEFVIRSASENSGPKAVHLLTAHSISLCESDPALRQVFSSGDLLLPDSRWLQFFSGGMRPKLTQVRGPDLFRQTLAKSQNSEIQHFFVGPSDFVNHELEATLKKEFPALTVSGFAVGPYPPITAESISLLVKEIHTRGRPIVWVGVGTPTQNFLTHEIARSTGLVVIAVGAAFEFLTKLKPEAPKWLSNLGFEWAFRLVSEPRRLWKRYLIGNFLFVFSILQHRLIYRR